MAGELQEQIRTLAQNLVTQGICKSNLDAMRMARSMVEGSIMGTKRSTEAVQGNPVRTGLASVAPTAQLEQENKTLREQLHVTQARISQHEIDLRKAADEIAHLKQRCAEQSEALARLEQQLSAVSDVAAIPPSSASSSPAMSSIVPVVAAASAVAVAPVVSPLFFTDPVVADAGAEAVSASEVSDVSDVSSVSDVIDFSSSSPPPVSRIDAVADLLAAEQAVADGMDAQSQQSVSSQPASALDAASLLAQVSADGVPAADDEMEFLGASMEEKKQEYDFEF